MSEADRAWGLAIGPYSQAVKANGLVFVSGMMPATKDGKQVEGSVAEKTHQMCRNAQAVLEAAGSGLGKAVKITVSGNAPIFFVLREGGAGERGEGGRGGGRSGMCGGPSEAWGLVECFADDWCFAGLLCEFGRLSGDE